jgi:cyclopropane fatty-acyl-phospholipid synthase-like methyltransferase
MFEKVISNNLRQPKGLFGKYIGKRLKSNLPVYNELEKIVELKSISNTFEIGYGPGYGIHSFASKYNISIHGIDFSNLMYKAASKLNRKFIVTGKVKLFFGDFSDYNENSNKYDLIYLINVIYFWKEIENNIKKIHSLLNKDGKIVIFMDSPEMLNNNKMISKSIFNLHNIDDVIKVMSNSGFSEIVKKEYSQYSGCFYLIGRKRV